MRFEITTFEWKSNALPTALQGHMDYLHSGCDVKSIYTFANRVEMFKRNNIPTSLVGFEPRPLVRSPTRYPLRYRDL
ncbi:hypothetical protein TNCV_858371 [Trichonephila clavipes]|nr:hypothetical protein TNCV_858371 [Trichonephila clavipes]